MLAGWQQRGRGRIALWTIANSFALVLGGEADRYGQWWSETLSAVARPDSLFRPALPALVQAGERMAICDIAAPVRVRAPDRSEIALVIDPAAGPRGCAAYWPAMPGLHRIIAKGQAGERSFAFLVLPAQALEAIRQRETGEETLRWAAEQTGAAGTGGPERRGSSWPYVLGWLLASAALWFAERRIRARPAA